ncbi:ABC transporter substrate-binding protein [Chroogloeocystis siderophila]|jgi:nitrate/nitrite transport system substrate-binding protein|uniref:Nitrate ABC transporter substrate-binding protein n=1 Tax=Chroogloeocystis siderophila 5.2 s.c.1 TaxID=247279 RepID=A0A1U7HUV5_9CHRO|nr:ABC transporter substrate-binding protein [Chroogloeocystis siderophila]OKH27372.1 nitrate ABC transporter substrate-binding protein [Chroogloeocystis siderophila 5.2 s.c.1]
MATLLEAKSGKISTLDKLRCSCGRFHASEDHWRFIEGMPQDPADLVADLIAMGQYKPEALKLAEKFTHAELRKTLVLQMLAKAEPEQQRICNDLIRQAGGLEEAFAAAFGPHATEFFDDTLRASRFRRRDFLIKVAATAAIVTLASCAGGNNTNTTQSSGEASTPGNLEKTDLTIGFIPIACATPIVISEPLGFYQKHGLNVTLRKMPNWAAVRESAIAGELDAYHMLSPMPIAVTLGLGSTTFPIQLASIENINGQSIAVALKHRDRIQGPADFKGMTIAVPFPYSMHNLLLRYYLASGGLNPDTDVAIQIVPPPDSVAQMSAGQIDAFLMPDNFGQRAVFEGIGFIHMLTKDLWDGHPCCAFAASQQWIDAHPNTFRAVNKAIIDSAAHANAAENRTEIAKVLSERRYLNQPEPVLQAVMTGNFEDGLGNTLNVPDRIGFDPYPWKSFAKWISSQLVRWDLMPAEKADYPQIAEQIYMTDLARELAIELGQNPPAEETRVENLKFDTFDPANPAAYLEQQSQKFNV